MVKSNSDYIIETRDEKDWQKVLNDSVDCSAICKQFGGGGHKGAARFKELTLFSNCYETNTSNNGK